MPKEISITGWRLLRVLVDSACGILALLAAFWLRIWVPVPFTIGLLPVNRLEFFSFSVPLVLLLQTALLYFLGFYELPHPRGNDDRLRRLTVAVALQALLMVAFFFLASERFPRTIVPLFGIFNVVLLLTTRQLLDRVVATPRRRVAVVGCGERANALARDIGRYPSYGVRIVGHVPAPGEEGEGPGARLGTVDDLPQLVADGVIDQVLVAQQQPSWQTQLLETLAHESERPTSILLLPNPFESLLGRTRFRSVHDIPLIEMSTDREWTGHALIKRISDLVLAALLLTMSAPVLLAAVIAIRLSSTGPAFYRQERVGRRQQRFVLWKLRTMRVGAEDETGEVLASRNDPRKTTIGSFLRATRIDEIPQLLNVLRGEMSMVGPRPERPGFVERYLTTVEGYGARFAVRPGATGLAQINGEYESSPENKLRYDLAYISNQSLWLDLSILLRTVRTVLTSRGI